MSLFISVCYYAPYILYYIQSQEGKFTIKKLALKHEKVNKNSCCSHCLHSPSLLLFVQVSIIVIWLLGGMELAHNICKTKIGSTAGL